MPGSTVLWMSGRKIVGWQSPGCMVDGTSSGFLGSVDVVRCWVGCRYVYQIVCYSVHHKDTG